MKREKRSTCTTQQLLNCVVGGMRKKGTFVKLGRFTTRLDVGSKSYSVSTRTFLRVLSRSTHRALSGTRSRKYGIKQRRMTLGLLTLAFASTSTTTLSPSHRRLRQKLVSRYSRDTPKSPSLSKTYTITSQNP